MPRVAMSKHGLAAVAGEAGEPRAAVGLELDLELDLILPMATTRLRRMNSVPNYDIL